MDSLYSSDKPNRVIDRTVWSLYYFVVGFPILVFVYEETGFGKKERIDSFWIYAKNDISTRMNSFEITFSSKPKMWANSKNAKASPLFALWKCELKVIGKKYLS